MSRPATIYGLGTGRLIYNPDFKASQDEKGLWTGSVTFTCRSADLVSLLPQLGSPCQEQGFTFMFLNGVEVANNEGDTSTVLCKYTGSQTPEFSFDEDSGGPYTTSISVTTGEEAIETLPKFKDLSPEDRYTVAQFKSGRYKIYKVTTGGDPEDVKIESLISRVDDQQIKIIAIPEDSLLLEIITLINKGIDSYLVPKPIYRYNYTQKTAPTGAQLNAVGKFRQSPPKAPTVAGNRNWLLLSINYDYANGVYSVSQEWLLSGPGGWNPDVYEEM